MTVSPTASKTSEVSTGCSFEDFKRTASEVSTTFSMDLPTEVDWTCSDERVVNRGAGLQRSTARKPSLLQRRTQCLSLKSQRSFESASTRGARTMDLPELSARTMDLPELSLDCNGINEQTKVHSQKITLESVLSDRYELLEQLGQGAIASVYRALQAADDKQVALKITRFVDFEMEITTQREYEILNEVRHPHIVRALGYFTYSMGSVLVLEYLHDSFTLEDGVAAAPGGVLCESVACRITRSLLQAIAHVHQRGYMHRDVKTQNVLVSGDRGTGDLRNLRLIDFNTAQRIADGCLTLTGTPDFLPPEVLLGDSHTKLSDVWSTGVCLHYMVSGTLPWQRNGHGSHAHFGQALTDRGSDGHNLSEALLAGPRWRHLSAESGRQSSPACGGSARGRVASVS